MPVLETLDEMDAEPLKTVISVHSPLTGFATKGNMFTSYAISLNSNNSCFVQPHSNVRRRYSEFACLRSLLKSHHPTIDPPALPQKTFFSRFNHIFIQERINGLQKFMEDIINIPVYLSNKGVHLFLQSSYSMSEIVEQVTGDVPAPKLMSTCSFSQTLHSDSSSTCSSEYSEPRSNTSGVKDILLNNQKSEESAVDSGYRTEMGIIIINDNDHSTPIPILPRRKTCSSENLEPRSNTNGIKDIVQKSEESAVDSGYRTEMGITIINDNTHSTPIPILQRHNKLSCRKLYCNSVSPPSSDSGNSSSDSSHSHRVSFNEKVIVAVVSNHLWNYGVQPIQNSV